MRIFKPIFSEPEIPQCGDSGNRSQLTTTSMEKAIQKPTYAEKAAYKSAKILDSLTWDFEEIFAKNAAIRAANGVGKSQPKTILRSGEPKKLPTPADGGAKQRRIAVRKEQKRLAALQKSKASAKVGGLNASSSSHKSASAKAGGSNASSLPQTKLIYYPGFDRNAIPTGDLLKPILASDRVHILFVASWRGTQFKGFAEEIRTRCNEDNTYLKAFKKNVLAFSTREGKNHFINIRTNADRCSIDLKRTLNIIKNKNLLKDNHHRIITNAIGRGRFRCSIKQHYDMLHNIANILDREVFVIPHKREGGFTIFPENAYHGLYVPTLSNITKELTLLDEWQEAGLEPPVPGEVLIIQDIIEDTAPENVEFVFRPKPHEKPFVTHITEEYIQATTKVANSFIGPTATWRQLRRTETLERLRWVISQMRPQRRDALTASIWYLANKRSESKTLQSENGVPSLARMILDVVAPGSTRNANYSRMLLDLIVGINSAVLIYHGKSKMSRGLAATNLCIAIFNIIVEVVQTNIKKVVEPSALEIVRNFIQNNDPEIQQYKTPTESEYTIFERSEIYNETYEELVSLVDRVDQHPELDLRGDVQHWLTNNSDACTATPYNQMIKYLQNYLTRTEQNNKNIPNVVRSNSSENSESNLSIHERHSIQLNHWETPIVTEITTEHSVIEQEEIETPLCSYCVQEIRNSPGLLIRHLIDDDECDADESGITWWCPKGQKEYHYLSYEDEDEQYASFASNLANLLEDLEDIPEEPKTQQSLSSYMDEHAPEIVTIVTQAIILAIGVFMPDFTVIMERMTKGARFLDQISKLPATSSRIEGYVAKILFGRASAEDRLKVQVLDMVKELDTCMKVPLDSLLDDASFPYHFDDCIARANELLLCLPRGESISSTLTHTLHKAKERQREVKDCLSTTSARPVPHVNLFFGDEGVGKTRASMYLSELMADEKYIGQGVYTLTAENKYAIPYSGQAIWSVQEFANAKDYTNDIIIRNFNSIVSNMHCNLEGAAVEHKMMAVKPTVLNIDTNRTPEEIYHKIPFGPGGSRGFMSRLTMWESQATWSEEFSRLPRNARPWKEDWSHIKFRRCIFEDGTTKPVHTNIGNMSKEWLTLSEVKLYSYREMEVHYNNFLPLQEKAKKVLQERQLAYEAKHPQAGNRGANIMSVCLYGIGGQGKTYIADEITQSLKMRFPVDSYRITNMLNPGFDITKHTLPAIYIFDDVMTHGNKALVTGAFMRCYNEMPSNSLVIWCTNEIPQMASFNTSLDTTNKIPNIKFSKIYKPLYAEMGMYRRAGYHGEFMILPKLELEEYALGTPNVNTITSFINPGRTQGNYNDHCYDVHNRQYKRVSDGKYYSRSAILSSIIKDWTRYVTTKGEIPIELVDYVLQPRKDVDAFLQFKTKEELTSTTSSITAILAAVARGKNMKLSSTALLKFRNLRATDFMYGAPVTNDEELQEYARFFIAKVEAVYPGMTAYIEVEDFGQMYYDGKVIAISLNQRKELGQLFISTKQAGSPTPCNTIKIYADQTSTTLRSFNEHFKFPGPSSVIVAEYALTDVYSGIWADKKVLASAMKIRPEHVSLLKHLIECETYGEYAAERFKAETTNTMQTWANCALDMLKKHYKILGLGVGIVGIVFLIANYFKGNAIKPTIEGTRAYLAAAKVGKVPEELEHYSKYTTEELKPMVEAIRKAETLIVYQDGSEEYIPDGSSRKIKAKINFDTSSAREHDRAVREREILLDTLTWDIVPQMVKKPITETVKTPGFVNELEYATKNLVYAYGERGSCYGLGVFGRFLVIPAHIGEQVMIKDDRFPNSSFNATKVLQSEGRDLAYYYINDATFGQFKDISHKFISAQQAPQIQARVSFMKILEQGERMYISGGLARLVGSQKVKYNIGNYKELKHFGELELTGMINAPTQDGDCGLPYVADEMANYGRPSIVGIHIGAYDNRARSIYAAVYQEDLEFLKSNISDKVYTLPPTVEPAKEVVKELLVKTRKCILTNYEEMPKYFVKYAKQKPKNMTVLAFKQYPVKVSDIPNLPCPDSLLMRGFDCGVCNTKHTIFSGDIKKYSDARIVLEGELLLSEDCDYLYAGKIIKIAKHKASQGIKRTYWERARDIQQETIENVGQIPPLIEFQSEVCEVIGVVPLHEIREMKCESYRPTIYHDYLRAQIPMEKIPIKSVADFTLEEREMCTRTTLGVPDQIAHQANLLDEDLPKLNSNIVNRVAKELTPYLITAFSGALTFSSNEEVLNGVSVNAPPGARWRNSYNPLNLNKSAGYTCVKLYNASLKSAFIEMEEDGHRKFRDNAKGIELREAFEELKEKIKNGEATHAQYPMYFTTTKKEELLPVEKAWKGRVFEAEDLMGTLVTRWVLGKFNAQSMDNDYKTGSCRVGMDPIRDFNDLAHYHLEQEVHFAGDINRHDKRVSWEMFEIILKAMTMAHKRTCPGCNSQKYCGWINACEFILFNIGKSKRKILNVIVQCHRGMPSGTAVTAPMNSLIVELFYYIAFCNLVEWVSFSTFKKYVHISTLGDDHIVSTTLEIAKKFNLVTVAKFLKETMGVILDSDRKDGKMVPYTEKIEDLTFISRSFVLLENSNFYTGALKKESITAKLFWVKKTAEGPQEYIKSLSSAIIESALHGEEYHEEISTAILHAMNQVDTYFIFEDVYIGYEELMHRYQQYCLGERGLYEIDNICEQVYKTSQNMNNIMKLNHLQQIGALSIVNEEYSTSNAMWYCKLTSYLRDTREEVIIEAKGINKKMAKHEAALQLINLIYVEPKIKNQGATVDGSRTQQMMPAAARTGSTGSGGKILQELPQQPETNEFNESAAQTVMNDQLLDDKNASTSKMTGGYAPDQTLPLYHQHNAITAYFSGTHQITNVSVTSKTTRGTVLFQFTMEQLLNQVPKLRKIIELHKYYIGHFIIKLRFIGPIGLTGEALVAMLPEEVMTALATDPSPMATIKKMYEYNIFGLEGNSCRTFELASVSNTGFALTTNGTNFMNMNTGIICMLHTPISSTFAESDTATITTIVEMALGENFNMSVPLRALDSIIEEDTPAPTRNIRPSVRDFIGMQLSSRFVVGSKTYAALDSKDYSSTLSTEPNWIVQSGNNPAKAIIQGIDFCITYADDTQGFYAWPLFVGGDVPTNTQKITLSRECANRDEVVAHIGQLLSGDNQEVYYLGYEGGVDSQSFVQYYALLTSLIAPIRYDPTHFRALKFVVVGANGTTYYTLPYVWGSGDDTDIHVTNFDGNYCLSIKSSIMTKDYYYADSINANEAKQTIFPLPLYKTTDTTEFVKSGYVVKSYPNVGNTYPYFGSYVAADQFNENVLATTCELTFANTVSTQRYFACGFSDTNMSYAASSNTRGFVPTREHWELCAQLQRAMLNRGWTTITGILTDGTNPIGEILYTDELGLQINATNSYRWTQPLTYVTIENLQQNPNPQEVDNSTMATYYNGPEVSTRGRPVFGKRSQQAAAAAGIIGGNIISGIGQGISQWQQQKWEEKQREKDRQFQKELQQMVTDGRLSEVEASKKWDSYMQERNLAWEQEKQKGQLDWEKEKNDSQLAWDKEKQQNSIQGQKEIYEANRKADIRSRGIMIAGDTGNPVVQTSPGEAQRRKEDFNELPNVEKSLTKEKRRAEKKNMLLSKELPNAVGGNPKNAATKSTIKPANKVSASKLVSSSRNGMIGPAKPIRTQVRRAEIKQNPLITALN
ncbi:hypothetical protein [Wuhan house centipede virus 3]|uniref:hypothetical protein n=1 Tax=Wuhan house centipede virus 3 TaxID=1923707 RepID=UPI00090AD807|nr:hypothetical protein [Wuhan house centipede virus 3]APG76659.1 hypothetical protein [Wuhan house centipede virus 3]APG78461.1 hypothetical protein [Wuhan house centipede virus 3]